MNEEHKLITIPEEGKLEVPPGAYLAIKREDARYRIALYYVLGFVLIIFYTLTLFWITNMGVNDLKDLLITISSILSGPLGFIIGYYFKSRLNGEE